MPTLWGYYEHQTENRGECPPPRIVLYICMVLFLALCPYGSFQSTMAFLDNSLIALCPPPAHIPQGGETDIIKCFTDKETETRENRYWSQKGEVYSQSRSPLALSL